MGVHSLGTGAGWLEDLGVDQPTGLDYREFNDFRIGLRKRSAYEHQACADSTVGFIHRPGGVAVLGVELTSGGKSDVTDALTGANLDGTYHGHGIVWSFHDASNRGILFCSTKAAGATASGDWTIMKLHPDLQWGGGDITWAGAHQFDASVDVFGESDFSDIQVEGTADFTAGVNMDATLNVAGDAAFAGDLSCAGDVSIVGGLTVQSASEFSTTDITTSLTVDGDLTVVNTLQCTSAAKLFVAAYALDTDGADITATDVYKVFSDGILLIDISVTPSGDCNSVLKIGDGTDPTNTLSHVNIATHAGATYGQVQTVPLLKDTFFCLSVTGAGGQVLSMKWVGFGINEVSNRTNA